MNETAARLSSWALAKLAAEAFAHAPLGCGVIVRARPGPVRDAWLKLLRAALPPSAPFRRMPASIADERLIGGLDIPATLRAGRPVAELGLLAETNGGVLVIAMAERLTAGIAAKVAAAIDTGMVSLERDGLTEIATARLGFVALDEGVDEETVPAILVERSAYYVDLENIAPRDIDEDGYHASLSPSPAFAAEGGRRPDGVWPAATAQNGLHEPGLRSSGRITLLSAPHPSPPATPSPAYAGEGSSRRHLNAPGPTADGSALATLVAVAAELGIASLRAPLFALRAARALAALERAAAIEDRHVALAAALTLMRRATRLPAELDSDSDEPPEGKPEPQQSGANEDPKRLEDVVIEAVKTAMPAALLSELKTAGGRKAKAATQGKAGERKISMRRGRPIGTRPGLPPEGRVALVATLRAAAPWQSLRRHEHGVPRTAKVFVRPDDFRIVRHQERRGATTIFVVDASGSSALRRLAEIKGAVELLLADCYVRRDSVALIAFRGASAEIVLPPTRSTARARHRLAGLPGGGGTPLASGLDAAAVLATQVRRTGQTPFVVLMTDGQANVARDGRAGRAKALEDALDAANGIRTAGLAALAIDSSAPSRARDAAATARIAEAMGARYLRLPVADAERVNAAVRSARG